MRWKEVYPLFWTALREQYPDLPTRSAYHREPDEIDANYIGTRSSVYGNAYAHMRFRGRGPTRDLIAAVYCGHRDDPAWRAMEPRILRARPALGALRSEETGAGAARLFRVIAPDLRPAQVVVRQKALVREVAAAYRALLAFV